MRTLKVALILFVFMEISLVIVNSPAHPGNAVAIEMTDFRRGPPWVKFIFMAQMHESVPLEAKDSPAAIEKFLIENGQRLIGGGDYKRVLDLVKDLTGEARNKVEIRTLEYFANLKGWVLNRDEVCKTNWWALRTELIKLGDNEATPISVVFLKDKDPYLRLYAAELLSHIGDKRALKDLREAGEKDENSQVRKNAKWAYEQISGKKF